jgi:hypothetical protein
MVDQYFLTFYDPFTLGTSGSDQGSQHAAFSLKESSEGLCMDHFRHQRLFEDCCYLWQWMYLWGMTRPQGHPSYPNGHPFIFCKYE